MTDSIDIIPNGTSQLEVLKPNKSQKVNPSLIVSNPSLENMGDQDMTPHSPASVDQLQEWKTWLSENNGTILAAMLQRIPTPVTRKISWGEFVSLFDLNYDPSEDVARQLDAIATTFPEWVRKFNFSYMALANATAKINADSTAFNSGLSAIAEKLNEQQSEKLDDSFRKLFF